MAKACAILLLACSLVAVDANLRGAEAGSAHVSLTEAERILEGARKDKEQARLLEIKAALKASYISLPKDGAGRLAPQAVRYVLHRHLTRRHGWSVRGLDPVSDARQSTHTPSNMDWAPADLVKRFEHQLGDQGMDLGDLAALVAAFEDVAQKETTERVQQLYTLAAFDRGSNLPSNDVSSIAQMYTASLIQPEWFNVTKFSNSGNSISLDQKLEQVRLQHRSWHSLEQWIAQQQEKHSSPPASDFAEVSQVAGVLSREYGAFNDKDCKTLKNVLVKARGPRGKKAGRVRLADFWKKGLEKDSIWVFSEKVDTLRSLGALDESNASSPMVIIPNYVASLVNCVPSTDLYEICCRSECEALMEQVERVIEAPSATPQELASAISLLSTDTAPARALPAEAVARLESIAAQHGGKVSIHGRLFSHFLHQAFPNECPYPFAAGSPTVKRGEWNDEDVGESVEERQKYVDEDACSADDQIQNPLTEPQWSEEFTMAAEDSQLLTKWPPRRRGSQRGLICCILVVAVGLLVCMRSPKAQQTVARLAASHQYARLLAVGAVSLAGTCLGIIDGWVVLCLLCVGVVLQALTKAQRICEHLPLHSEKEKV